MKVILINTLLNAVTVYNKSNNYIKENTYGKRV